MSNRGERRVDQVIASTPNDVSGLSDGFAAGEVGVLAPVVVADNTSCGNAPHFSSEGGREGDNSACFQGNCASPENG